MTNTNDALFAPAAWIASGPGPATGNKAQEFTATDVTQPSGAVVTSSYASIAYTDYHSAATTSPAVPSLTATPLGWQSISQFPTTAQPSGSPSARTGTSLASTGNGFFLFGGRDSTNAPADPQGIFWQYELFGAGWTSTATAAGPLPSARSGAAAGRQTTGGSCFLNNFTVPCAIDDLQIVVAGGAGPTGTPTNELQLFHHTRTFTNFSIPPTITTSWQLVGTLPFANAGMQSAAGIVPFNATVAGISSSQPYAGGMMIYGQAVTATNSVTQGCVLFGAAPLNPTINSPPQAVPIQNLNASCVGSPSVFDQNAAPGIGFRTGATLVADNGNPTNFYLFGGRKTAGAATALQNDIWKATVACAGAPAVCPTTTTWTQISGGGVPPNFPTPRAGAGGGTFANGKLAIYGGTDAGGNLGDLWEFDLAANTWRLVTQDTTANVLAPSIRTGFAMTGDSQRIFNFGGTLASGSVTDQAWLAAHESAAKLLVKLPFSLPQLDQARNVKLTVDAQGTGDLEQAFVWDGTNWRFLASFDFSASTPHILVTTSGPATSLLQDGNIYLLFHFDPYPFIFLNLAFSTQAAYAAPLILLASNQSAVRDRATLEHSVDEAEDADKKDSEILARLVRIEAMLAEHGGSKS